MRHGPTCVICGEAIWDVNEIVNPAAYPWLLLDARGDAHRGCANTAVAEVDKAKREAERDYREAQGWPSE